MPWSYLCTYNNVTLVSNDLRRGSERLRVGWGDHAAADQYDFP